MENEPVTIDWIGVALQWGFFFSFLAILFVPAFLFRNLARRNGKSGVAYFFVGLGVAGGCFGVSTGVVTTITRFIVWQDEIRWIMLFVLYFLTALLVWGAFNLVKKNFLS
jgi:hypothetical protein